MTARQLTPVPTTHQAVQVLEILQRWTKRGWWYDSYMTRHQGVETYYVHFSDPDPDAPEHLETKGVNHFDALCQATAAMQILLEERPET